jgi:hypothetical protein
LPGSNTYRHLRWLLSIKPIVPDSLSLKPRIRNIRSVALLRNNSDIVPLSGLAINANDLILVILETDCGIVPETLHRSNVL